MKVIESFKLRTKRFCLFYEFEKMWILLTVINIVAVFLIIRGSTVPLLFDNAVLRFLFYTDKNADKTLYNISISYFAAYIFYLIQIYYPERKKTLNALLSTRTSVRNMSMWIYRFLFVWDMYKQDDNEAESIVGAKIETVYLKDDTGFVYKVDRETFKSMVSRISKSYHEIINSPDFQNCDYSLRRLLLSPDIAQYIERLYEKIVEAEGLDGSGAIRIGYSKTEICALKRKLEYFGKLFDISMSGDYKVTIDKDDIEKIERRHEKLSEVVSQNHAFFEVLSQKNLNDK